MPDRENLHQQVMELIRGCKSRRESAYKVATALGISPETAYRYIRNALKEFGQEYALADAEIKEIVVTDCLETLCSPDAGPKAKEKARADLIRVWATTARRITLVNPDGTSLQNLSDDELQAVEQQLGLESAPPGPDQSPVPVGPGHAGPSKGRLSDKECQRFDATD